jgi:prepilin-type N-terminal cleavage/methylation domain-containing protein
MTHSEFRIQNSEFKTRRRFARHSAFCILHSALRPRSAFTLMELLIVMLIMSILAALALSALAGATEQAREARTRSIIAKLDQLIAAKYDEYQSKPVHLRPFLKNAQGQNVVTDQRVTALRILYGKRETMRLELPDRIADLCTNAEHMDLQADGDLNTILPNVARIDFLTSVPAATRAYKRRAFRAMSASGLPWTNDFQGAECLYLIVSNMRDGDKNALDFFQPSEIGDADEDGMLEIHDAWGKPIEFYRWPSGYLPSSTPSMHCVTMQTDAVDTSGQPIAPDPFDPLKSDLRWTAGMTPLPFAVYPLIFSAGRDEEYGLGIASTSTQYPANDPYGESPGPGTPNGTNTHGDNITNHFQQTP